MEPKQPPNKQQMEQTAQKIGPKADNIARQKNKFIKHLRKNGVVSSALAASGLARRTAYEHCSKDTVFADLWDDALESAHGDLVAEAYRRAMKGVETVTTDRNGRKKLRYVKSDTLLISMIKRGDARNSKKKIIQVGRMAIETIREAGLANGLTEAQILAIQNDLVKRFENVSLS